MTKTYYLDHWLADLSQFLAAPNITDIMINKPGEIWTEALGGKIERHDIPALSEKRLFGLARQIAAGSHQGINRASPLLSASLPDGARVQVVVPPATRDYPAFAIRRHIAKSLSLTDYASQSFFDRVNVQSDGSSLRPSPTAGQELEFLQQAVRSRKNILVSGGTSSGKTTFINSLIAEVEQAERLIYIEDAPELRLSHANAVGLIAPRSRLSEADVTTDELLNAALRMRPDRIILGEVRGPEAFTFLRAINTGHPGSMTTIHADSPDHAVDQLALLVLQSGARLAWEDVRQYVRSTIDIFVQLKRTQGVRKMTELVVSRKAGLSQTGSEA